MTVSLHMRPGSRPCRLRIELISSQDHTDCLLPAYPTIGQAPITCLHYNLTSTNFTRESLTRSGGDGLPFLGESIDFDVDVSIGRSNDYKRRQTLGDWGRRALCRVDGKRRKGSTLARWIRWEGGKRTWVGVVIRESFDATRLAIVAATPLGGSRWCRSHHSSSSKA